MNKTDLRMMYKADTGDWPVKHEYFGIPNYKGEPKKEYLKWLEEFFPTNTDLNSIWKRGYKYISYSEWLEDYILEQIDELQLLLRQQ
jgi:hypothetical protein